MLYNELMYTFKTSRNVTILRAVSLYFIIKNKYLPGYAICNGTYIPRVHQHTRNKFIRPFEFTCRKPKKVHHVYICVSASKRTASYALQMNTSLPNKISDFSL
jgi:hypothetical protein